MIANEITIECIHQSLSVVDVSTYRQPYGIKQGGTNRTVGLTIKIMNPI